MSTNRIELEKLSVGDLWSLHERVSQILSVRINSEKRELEKRLAILNRDMGALEENDEFHNAYGKTRRKYPRVRPKYRNPLTTETWSGRGKRPRWLVAAIRTGRKIEDFEIDGARESMGPTRERVKLDLAAG